MASTTVRTVEELSLRAWPALEQALYDGWLLRFANGYSKRANSVNPLGTSSLPLQAKIDHCEQIYRERSLRLVFRLTPLARPGNLDQFLADRGFVHNDETSVQLLELGSSQPPATGAARLWPEFTLEWGETFAQIGSVPANQTHQAILAAITPPRCFALLLNEDRPVACGLGVLENGYVGLFDIITARAERRKGYGRELIGHILHWASRQGVHSAYLQVMLNNEPALSLYRGLGFREIYRYWYRLKDG